MTDTIQPYIYNPSIYNPNIYTENKSYEGGTSDKVTKSTGILSGLFQSFKNITGGITDSVKNTIIGHVMSVIEARYPSLLDSEDVRNKINLLLKNYLDESSEKFMQLFGNIAKGIPLFGEVFVFISIVLNIIQIRTQALTKYSDFQDIIKQAEEEYAKRANQLKILNSQTQTQPQTDSIQTAGAAHSNYKQLKLMQKNSMNRIANAINEFNATKKNRKNPKFKSKHRAAKSKRRF